MSGAIEVYSAICFEYDGTQFIREHNHRDTYQIYYVSRGKVKYKYAGKKIELKAGEFLFIPPMISHEMPSYGIARVFDMKFRISDKVLERNAKEQLGGKNIASEEEKTVLDMLCELVQKKNKYSSRIFALHLEAILCNHFAKFGESSGEYDSASEDIPIDTENLSLCVKRALPYIYGFLVQPVEAFSIDALAKQVGYNKKYLSMKFTEDVGISIARFFRIARMNKAKEFLTNSHMSVSYIAELLGYKNSPHFVKSFREYLGMTPGEYRKQFQK